MKLVLRTLKKENFPGRKFQESHENFSATFKRKVARIESHEDLKIKILREFEVAKCLKGGEIMHLVEPKCCNFLPRIQ